jgi:hypothetical protein
MERIRRAEDTSLRDGWRRDALRGAAIALAALGLASAGDARAPAQLRGELPREAAALQESPPTTDQDPEPEFVGRAFVFRADLEAGRAAGWTGAASDDEVLEAIRAGLEARLRGVGRFVEARVQREEDRRFSVTFVGDQPPELEELLIAGLSNPARIEGRFLAGDGDLASLGTGAPAEEQRLRAWRAAHPGRPLHEFNGLARDGGGPAVGVFWAAVRGGGEPMLLLRDPTWRFERAHIEGGLRMDGTPPAPVRLGFRLTPAAKESFGRFVATRGAETLVLTLNDEVAARETPDGDAAFDGERLSLGADYTPAEARGLILAAAGEPYAAPLVFVERATRRLPNVERR